MLPSISKIAELLGGDAQDNGQVLCPGPGHGASDRSLSIKLDSGAPAGFVVHSFAGDDAIACRDYVREKIGLPPFEATKKKPNGGAQPYSPTVAKYVYRLADGKPYLQVQRTAAKEFPQYHWDGEKWISGKPQGPKVPYRLPELIAAASTEKPPPIYIVEGEKDVDSLAKIGFVATTASGGAAAKWAPELTPYFKDRHVVILPDADKPGREHAEKVAGAINDVAASVRILDLYPERHDGGDVSNWLVDDTAGAKLAKLAKKAPLWELSKAVDEKPRVDDDDSELVRLAKMSALDYDRARKEAGKRLGITRLSTLDLVVKAKRAELGLDADDGKSGHAIEFLAPEPWPNPVNGAEVLDEIAKIIGSHVIMPEHSRDACALWAAHTFLTDCTMISPRLAFTSPVKGCGKTTALDVMGQLVLRPLAAANVSPSAVFRVIEACNPTLLIDEADSFLKDNEELRGVLNSGHRRGGSVLRTVAVRDDFEVRSFSTYGACVIALIGQLPGTLADRSVPIALTRRKRDEAITPFRLDRVGHLVELARKLARWAADNEEAIATVEPEMPPGLYNRAADNWRPLLAIATVAKGDWLARAHKAAIASAGAEDEAWLELALKDIRAICTSKKLDRISSTLLTELMAEIEGRPWAEYGRNEKPITPGKLARLLKPLAIVPQQIRFGPDDTRKGYYLHQFKEAFSRYLGSEEGDSPPEGAPEPKQGNNPDEMGTSDLFQNGTPQPDVSPRKSEKSNNGGLCDTVSFREGGNGGEPPVGTHLGAQERTAWGVKFTLLGQAQPGAACLYCTETAPDDVGPVMVVKSAGPLHEACAPAWISNQDRSK